MLKLIRSWGDSLKLLLPANLKEWGLLTLNGSLLTYKTLFKYFWWLIVAIAIMVHFDRPYLLPYTLGLIAIWCFVSILAARPSVEKKDSRYFAQYWAHALVALLILALVIAIWLIIVFFGYSRLLQEVVHYTSRIADVEYSWSQVVSRRYYGQSWVEPILMDVCFVKPLLFVLFFLCDTRLSVSGTFKSIWNGIKLLFYILPIAILLAILLKCMDVVARSITPLFGAYKSVLYVLGVVVLFPLFVNILLYLYLKQIYEHPERYQ